MTHPTPLQRLALIAALALAGCFPINRTCTGKRCWVEASPEQIDRHCRKGLLKWDSGNKPSANDGRRAVCCVKLRAKRYWIFVASDSWNCMAHEECHIEEHQSGRNEHWRCDGFGANSPGKCPGYINRSDTRNPREGVLAKPATENKK